MVRGRALGAAIVACAALLGCGLSTSGISGGTSSGSGGATTGTATGGEAAAGSVTGTGGGGGCMLDLECPIDTFCGAHACVAGTCKTTPQPSGTPLVRQVPGDCQQAICDGDGGETTVADDTDVLVDNNQCTSDLCSGGSASNPAVADGTPCGVGLACKGGQCTGCTSGSECGVDSACLTNTCAGGTCGIMTAALGTLVADNDPTDCQDLVCDGFGNMVVAADDSEIPPPDLNPCVQAYCVGGAPSQTQLPNGTDCGGGWTCVAGVCSQCSSSAQCFGDECNDGDCQGGTCTLTPKADSSPCSGGVCVGGACVQCQIDAQCPPASGPCVTPLCSGGTCVEQPVADSTDCSAAMPPGECQQSICQGGVCNVTPVGDGGACTGVGTCCAGACCLATCCAGACCLAGEICCASTQTCKLVASCT